MKNVVKNTFYVAATSVVMGVNNALAVIDPGEARVDPGLGDNVPLDERIQGYVVTLMTYLAVLAVLYGLWGAFHILTAGGEEDRVKKGKDIIIQSIIGLVVIFLVGSLVNLVLGILTAQ